MSDANTARPRTVRFARILSSRGWPVPCKVATQPDGRLRLFFSGAVDLPRTFGLEMLGGGEVVMVTRGERDASPVDVARLPLAA